MTNTSHASKQTSQTLKQQLLFLIISGVIFSIAYAIHSDMSGTVSKPETLATFQAHWPYRPRFLVAWIAYKIFGGPALNTIPFRAAFAFACWIPMTLLTLRLARRLQVSSEVIPYVYVSFLLIMLAHYCLPNVAAQYYIYDMPAILFYLIVFLLLTSDNRGHIILGGILTLVFTMNREPIAVALFHAFAWWFVQYWERNPTSTGIRPFPWGLARYIKRDPTRNDNRFFAMLCIAVTFIGTLVLRQLLVILLHGDIQGSSYGMFYEDDQIRIVANFRRVVTEWGSFQQFVATGFGVVFYLPFVFKSQSLRTRAATVASLLPLFPLLFVGNFFTELRIYGEYTPLMTCLLATTVSWCATLQQSE